MENINNEINNNEADVIIEIDHKEYIEALNKSTIKCLRKTRPTIYTSLKHVSNSGMLRVIDVFYIRNNHKHSLNQLMVYYGHKLDTKYYGIRISGMDMGFSLVYNLGRYIFPKGFKYRKNEYHRNNDIAKIDKDGGYAFKHEWW